MPLTRCRPRCVHGGFCGISHEFSAFFAFLPFFVLLSSLFLFRFLQIRDHSSTSSISLPQLTQQHRRAPAGYEKRANEHKMNTLPCAAHTYLNADAQRARVSTQVWPRFKCKLNLIGSSKVSSSLPPLSVSFSSTPYSSSLLLLYKPINVTSFRNSSLFYLSYRPIYRSTS